MNDNRWVKLQKVSNWYELQPEPSNLQGQCHTRTNFVQLAFDHVGDYCVATDSKGNVYRIEIASTCPYYQKLGFIGQASFIAFNPTDESEILVGLASGKIKIFSSSLGLDQFSLLSGHSGPPGNVSFYKNFCLTSSSKEVIIWCLKSYRKVHRLFLDAKSSTIRKAAFSNLGHVVALYPNDCMQAWMFDELNVDTTIDVRASGVRNVKDFVFTRNGRAAVITSTQNKVVILDTCGWSPIKSLSLPENFVGIKQLCVVPSQLDGGANRIVAAVSSTCTLHFFDLNASCFVDSIEVVDKIKKIAVSSDGRYIAAIEKEGTLKLTSCSKLILNKSTRTERVKKCRPKAHGVDDHLHCVRKTIKKELCLKRLMPILKEFGEYPEKYRTVIWSMILKLPSNKNAFIAITNKATQDKFILDVFKNCNLADRNKTSLLTTMINYVIQWCPLLLQCSFLPNFVFPFLIVFQKDLLLGFELILSVLMNYCQKWFEYHPLPPLNILGIAENVLLEADPTLMNVFCERKVTSTVYAWPLLRTTMSEVLSSDEWLILWDHLFSLRAPNFFLMCVIAYSICSRNIIMSLLRSPEDFKKFYGTQGHVKARDILKVARQLDGQTPHHLHPNHYLRNQLIFLPTNGPYPPFIMEECPKFLTEDSHVLQLEKLKERKAILQEYKRQTALVEEKRLNREVENFMKEIQRKRLDEVEKCVQEQACNVNYNILEELRRCGSVHTCNCKEIYSEVSKLEMGPSSSVDSKKDKETTKRDKYRTCRKLQHDVDELEYEVQSFLNSIRSCRSQVNVT